MHHKRTSIWDHVVEAFVTPEDRQTTARHSTKHRSVRAYWRDQLLPPSLLRRLSPTQRRVASFSVDVLITFWAPVTIVLLLILALALLFYISGRDWLWHGIRIQLGIFLLLVLLAHTAYLICGSHAAAVRRITLARRAQRTRFRHTIAASSPESREQLVAAEHAARVRFWSDELVARRGQTSSTSLSSDPLVPTLIEVLSLPLCVVVIADMFFHAGFIAAIFATFRTPIAPLFIPLMLFTLTALGYLRFRKARARLLASLTDARCPDCAYDLASLFQTATAIAPWHAPRRCPECGSPWPLIPPPIPAHRTPEGIAKANQSLWTRNILNRPPKAKPPHHSTR